MNNNPNENLRRLLYRILPPASNNPSANLRWLGYMILPTLIIYSCAQLAEWYEIMTMVSLLGEIFVAPIYLPCVAYRAIIKKHASKKQVSIIAIILNLINHSMFVIRDYIIGFAIEPEYLYLMWAIMGFTSIIVLIGLAIVWNVARRKENEE